MKVIFATLLVFLGIAMAEEGKVLTSTAKNPHPSKKFQTLTPEQKNQIEEIEKEIRNLRQETLERIRTLSSSESEDEARKIPDLKIQIMIKILELRKQIAEIKGEHTLAREFDKAIDNLKNPEKYLKQPVKFKREIKVESSPIQQSRGSLNR